MIIKKPIRVEIIIMAQNKFSDCNLAKENIKKIINIPMSKFIKCWPLNVMGLPDINPWSFKKAIQEPENVMAPIATPKDISIKD